VRKDRRTDVMADQAVIHQREADFHDEWARSTDIHSISVREAFESPTAVENRFLLQLMGSLAGKRLLDVGAGLGESSVYFALQGAQVTTTDISPEMVETALKLGRLYGVKLEGAVSTGESLSVPENSYDFVYLANVIHHVQDRASLFAQVQRALKPGGRFFSIDPIAYNPVINVYRRMATKVRTEDERPLTRSDIALARRFFPDTQHREFWIASLLLFIKYLGVDRTHPNADRYWKRILKESDDTLTWKPLRAVEAALTRIPGIRWWAWNTVMWGTKR
jgi:2-polyprenyl-3-methyl-5-hydroxy-6-metoxy-1,4-benzoquinol methylase